MRRLPSLLLTGAVAVAFWFAVLAVFTAIRFDYSRSAAVIWMAAGMVIRSGARLLRGSTADVVQGIAAGCLLMFVDAVFG